VANFTVNMTDSHASAISRFYGKHND